MNFPINIPLGRSVIPVHFVCETLSYFLAYRYYIYLRSRNSDQISEQNRLFVFIAAAFGAFIGSHLIGTFENPSLLTHLSFIYFMNNKTIVGGLLGGLVCVEITKIKLNIKVSSGDLMVYPLILAMIIGRTGCFLSGLEDGTYGIPSTVPWAMDLGDGIKRHPTSLYEIVFWIALWTALLLFEKNYDFSNGSRFRVFMATYLVFRFFIEFIKPDYFFSFGVSVIQLVCLSGILYYYKVFLNPRFLIINQPNA